MFIYGVVCCIVFAFIEGTLHQIPNIFIADVAPSIRFINIENTRICVGIFDHEEKVTKI